MRKLWNQCNSLPLFRFKAPSVPGAAMASVPAPSPTVVDQTTLMKKYLQFVAALTDTNTRKLFLYVEMIFYIYILYI